MDELDFEGNGGLWGESRGYWSEVRTRLMEVDREDDIRI